MDYTIGIDPKVCSVAGCDRTDRVFRLKKGNNNLYCGKHQHHILRYGRIKEFTRCSPNKISIKKTHAEVELRDSKGNLDAVTLIDLGDVSQVKKHKWHLKKGRWQGYAVANKDRKVIRLHRVLLRAKPGQICDHINHNKLDNRKSNLRFVDPTTNSINTPKQKNNTSGYAGVTWDKSKKKWAAQICVNYKNKLLGRFDNLQEALSARQAGEIKYFGEVIKR